jgi:hypothetical protein
MPQPVSYNPGTPVSGSIQENNISYVVDGQNRNYRGGFGGLSWMSEVPAANNVIFIGNSVSLGRGPANIPLFYPSYNNSAANIIYAANTLPGSPRNFTTTGSAYNWAATNNFFINNSDNPIPRIDADGLAFYVDANQPTSYPQTGTSWYDMSGFGNNGTLTNGPTWNSNGWFGFDGADDFVNCGNGSSLNILRTVTMELWFNVSGFGSPWTNVFGKMNADGDSSTRCYTAFINSSGYVHFVTADTSGQEHLDSTNFINTGRWYHWIGTIDRNTGVLKQYVNSTLNTTGTVRTTDIVTNSDPLRIGYAGNYYERYNGLVSFGRIYSKALTQTEIKQNYFQSNIVQDGLVFMVDASNLVSYPKSGTSTYNLTGSQVGTLTNGVGFNSRNGGVFDFDGTDDTISIPYNTEMDPTGGITLEAWIYPEDLTTVVYQEIFRKENGTGRQLFSFQLNGTIISFGTDTTGNGYDELDIAITPSNYINRWCHFVATYTSGYKAIYIDGQLLGSNTGVTGNLIQGNAPYYIGSLQGAGEFFNGYYASFKMYSRGLSASEVQQNYQATKDKFLGQNIVTNGLQLSYDFANKNSYPGTGTTIYDLSGNSNNGTLLNNPQFSPNANGGVISWDGTDDYIDTGKTATQLGFYGANYTMEAWVYPTSLTSDRTMFGTNQSALRQGLHLVFRSGQIYQGHYASDFTAGTVTTNNWYQIVYTYNASTGACEIFKNSVSQGTGTISSFIGTTNILIASWGGSYYFEGPGGIYRIYNRVLSSTEILQNYNAQKTRFGL